MSGLFVSGLDEKVTYTLNARFVIERAPEEGELVTMARPSAEADHVVFAVYSEAIRLMPPGVRLADNAVGAWFGEVARRAIRQVQPQVQRGVQAAAPIARDVLNRIIDEELRKRGYVPIGSGGVALATTRPHKKMGKKGKWGPR